MIYKGINNGPKSSNISKKPQIPPAMPDIIKGTWNFPGKILNIIDYEIAIPIVPNIIGTVPDFKCKNSEIYLSSTPK